MAVVNVQEKWSGTNGDVEQATGAQAYRWNATRAYTVLHDTAIDAIQAVRTAGLPDVGDPYSATYPWIICQTRRAIPLSPMLYEVVCGYSGKDSPLLDPYEKRWEAVESSAPTDRDASGNLITNTVSDLVTGLTKDVADPVYVVTRNESAEPDSENLAYWNAVNSDTFKSWPAGTARMLPITAYRVIDGATYYWRVTYRIQFRSDGWTHRFVNKGKRYLASDGSTLLTVKDKLGVEEALLASDGTLLASGAAPHFLTPSKYQSKAFGALSLS